MLGGMALFAYFRLESELAARAARAATPRLASLSVIGVLPEVTVDIPPSIAYVREAFDHGE